MIVKVPEGASAGELVVKNGQQASQTYTCDIGIMIAENLHPVTNPAVDAMGNLYSTFSGSRGQKVPQLHLQDRSAFQHPSRSSPT